MDLTKLLKPKSVAIVGASEKASTMGGDLLTNVKLWGKIENAYLVNPNYDTIFEHKCYRSLENIPVNIDLVVLCTPKKTIPDLLRQAAKKGCGGAVVFASGYSETRDAQGKQEEKELSALCKELGIALMGPNCGGFINYIDKVCGFAFIIEDRDRRGNVGFVSQSGQLCQSLMENTMKFSFMASVGNCCSVTVEDYMDFLVDDPDTKVVAAYIEGVKNPKRLAEVLKKAAIKRKPIVVLKTGMSEKGSKLASSHTGSMSGADKVFDAVIKKFGVIRVKDLQELIAISTVLATLPELPKKPTFSSMAFSGGETVVCADVAYLNGVEFPDFNQSTTDAIQAMLPYYATANNPLDMTFTMSYDSDIFAKALRTIMDDPNIGMCLLCFTILQNNVTPDVHTMIDGIEKVVRAGNAKPMAFIPLLENTREPKIIERLGKLGVPVLPPTNYAFAVLKYLADYISYSHFDKTLDLALPDIEEAAEAKGSKQTALSEFTSKELLKKYGLPVTGGAIAASEAEAVAIAGRTGYPLVMKIESTDILHKSDVGGVVLNIDNEKAAVEAYRRILANAKKNAPNAKINGVLIQEMAPKGLEMIVGVNNDPQFGPVILCGLGGIFVEIFKDVALYPAPLNKNEALKMLASLEAYPLLTGARGQKVLDVDALADAIVTISKYAADNKNTVSQVDINPLLVYPKGEGVRAVDALVINK
ncbi:acetate--CoA ligase family protein [Acetonema longum]|uniref:Putative acetyl-CoA synthetase n=1 Tax=Acetonema longum DSM 6540 TaxID=1009370 RepID=F7NKL2_9FIRM|nr:acetate--CoA ligase family protein [Acetonema longum]EGO63420.1 putative acetyl-CoA synthetase [Acetonema longum DSM 6540]